MMGVLVEVLLKAEEHEVRCLALVSKHREG